MLECQKALKSYNEIKELVEASYSEFGGNDYAVKWQKQLFNHLYSSLPKEVQTEVLVYVLDFCKNKIKEGNFEVPIQCYDLVLNLENVDDIYCPLSLKERIKEKKNKLIHSDKIALGKEKIKDEYLTTEMRILQEIVRGNGEKVIVYKVLKDGRKIYDPYYLRFVTEKQRGYKSFLKALKSEKNVTFGTMKKMMGLEGRLYEFMGRLLIEKEIVECK